MYNIKKKTSIKGPIEEGQGYCSKVLGNVSLSDDSTITFMDVERIFHPGTKMVCDVYKREIIMITRHIINPTQTDVHFL